MIKFGEADNEKDLPAKKQYLAGRKKHLRSNSVGFHDQPYSGYLRKIALHSRCRMPPAAVREVLRHFLIWRQMRESSVAVESKWSDGRRWKGEDCVRGRGLIPRSIPTAAALYRWGRRDATHTHMCTCTPEHARAHAHLHLCVMVGIKKPCQMLEPFPNTLEDHAKHKVGELGRIPLFPPSASEAAHAKDCGVVWGSKCVVSVSSQFVQMSMNSPHH